jgi:hypothetical protein
LEIISNPSLQIVCAFFVGFANFPKQPIAAYRAFPRAGGAQSAHVRIRHVKLFIAANSTNVQRCFQFWRKDAVVPVAETVFVGNRHHFVSFGGSGSGIQ